MITVEEARTIIRNTIPEVSVASLPLKEAGSFVLAADIIAFQDIPAFRQSSVDGYAFIHTDRNMLLRMDGKVQAGSSAQYQTGSGTATRIFTGAPVPEGADTVVMQEKTLIAGDRLEILDKDIRLGDNVRAVGSEIRAGDTAMQKGTLLTPAALGFLSGIGITQVDVYRAPKVTIVVTGNEIRQPGQPLLYGQVYDASSVMLEAALKQAGIREINLAWSADTYAETEQKLRDALQESELVLVTGGVSVGDYDFVAAAAKACNIHQQFHRIKQKPGKPLFYGTFENKLFFGLPGNPSSVLTCFYEYVLPALEQYMHRSPSVRVLQAIAKTAYRKPAGLTHFIKAYHDGKMVMPLQAQESYRLHSFAQANCLLVLPENSTGCAEGEEVTIHLLPI